MKLRLFNRTVDIHNILILEDYKEPDDVGYLVREQDMRYTTNVDFIVKGIFGLTDRSEFDNQAHLDNVNTLNNGWGHKYITLDDYDQFTSLEPEFMPREFKYKLTDCEVIHMTSRDRTIQYLIKNNEDDYFLIMDDEFTKYPVIYYMGYAYSSGKIKDIINLMESEYTGH